jgi:hypothetical protein
MLRLGNRQVALEAMTRPGAIPLTAVRRVADALPDRLPSTDAGRATMPRRSSGARLC